MADPRDIVDISSLTPSGSVNDGQQGGDAAGPRSDRGLQGRPWLAISWKCCGVYSRIYRAADGKAYRGACPKCGRSVRVPISENGTSNRFFEAS